MITLLFDIDGTLVRTGGAGKGAMEAALQREFGVHEIFDTVAYSGRTDRSIGRELLTVHGLEPTTENVRRLTDAYLDQLPHFLRDRGGEVCPQIEPIVKAAAAKRDGVLLGLLTGNIRRGAAAKLGHFGLWDYFPLGGFGDDHFDRDDVARSALAEVRRHAGRVVNAADVWVIGDTPLDVQCARAIGAKAVAVATGWHSFDELAGCRPDAVFRDLTEASDLLRTWGVA